MSALSISAAPGTEVAAIARTDVHTTTGEVGLSTPYKWREILIAFASTINIKTGDQRMDQQ